MKQTESLTLRTSKENAARIDEIAMRMDRPRNYVLNEAINQYLAYQQILIAKVHEGVRQADNGELIAHTDVFARFQAKVPKQPE
jgi:predicted transcriptional regulator